MLPVVRSTSEPGSKAYCCALADTVCAFRGPSDPSRPHGESRGPCLRPIATHPHCRVNGAQYAGSRRKASSSPSGVIPRFSHRSAMPSRYAFRRVAGRHRLRPAACLSAVSRQRPGASRLCPPPLLRDMRNPAVARRHGSSGDLLSNTWAERLAAVSAHTVFGARKSLVTDVRFFVPVARRSL